jgi:ABC-type dipeptide/oligopeptide/nickel transport system permease component
MLRFALLRAAGLVAGVAGAALLSAAIAAIGDSAAVASVGDFLSAMLARAPGVLAFETGASTLTGEAARASVLPALSASLQLLLLAVPAALGIGMPLGAALADRTTRSIVAPVVQLAGAVPVFCGALAVVLVFAPLSPEPTGDVSLFAAIGARDGKALLSFFSAALPAGITIGLAGAGAVALALRKALEKAASEPYCDGLSRLGLGEREIMRRFVYPQAAALALKDTGPIVLAIFAAAAVAEWILGWPGAGAAFIHAAALEDWAVAALIVFAIGVIRAAADFSGPVAAHALLSNELL